MGKKLISAVIVFMLVLSSTVSALADSVSDKESTNISSLEPMITSLLGMARSDDKGSGLSNVSFENLSLGDEIPAYKENKDSLEEMKTEYYPILEGDDVVAIVIVNYDQDGKPLVQLGKSFANELQGFVEDNSQIALVESGNNLYAYSGDDCDVVDTLLPQLDSNKTLETEKFDGCEDNIEYTKIKAIDDLEINNDTTGASSKIDCSNLLDSTKMNQISSEISASSSSGDFEFLSAPVKLQENYNICWACCVASIGQYITGTNYTGKKVCSKMGVNYKTTTGESISTSVDALSEIYNIDSTSYSSAPKYSKIKSEIDSDHPIWAGFKNRDLGGHAVLIRGYSYGTSSSGDYKAISYMDPNESSYQYLYFTTDKTYQFSYGDYTFTCKAYIKLD